MAKKRVTRASQHRSLLRANYVHYEALLGMQGGGCAICGRPPRRRRLDMDHDHKQMRVRGLLCVRCNGALRYWVTPEWLRTAAEYLENPPFTKLQTSQDNEPPENF